MARSVWARLGDWKIVYQRFNRRSKCRVFQLILIEPPSCALTSTALAHENNGEQAIGRSHRGLSKILVLVDALGNPADVMLTPDQTHDVTCAEAFLDGVDPEALKVHATSRTSLWPRGN